MKIALNKKYLTNDNKIFAPKRTKRGNKIFEVKNMLGGKVWSGRYEIIFIDELGNEYLKKQLKKEIKK